VPNPFQVPGANAAELAWLESPGVVVARLGLPHRASDNTDKGGDRAEDPGALTVVNGALGWYEYNSALRGGDKAFFLTVAFAADDVRPMILNLDGCLLDVVCGGTTGGFGAEEIQSHVYGPFSLQQLQQPARRACERRRQATASRT
jgi:hypothetical protein